MRVFLSYSINDSDLYVIPRLSQYLRANGHLVKSSVSLSPVDPDSSQALINSNIKNSNLFIGIITKWGNQHQKVRREFAAAGLLNTPRILLVERGVEADLKDPNVISFNRDHTDFTMNAIHQKIEDANRKLTQYVPDFPVPEYSKPITHNAKQQQNNAWAWVLGGAALLLALSVLSSDDDK